MVQSDESRAFQIAVYDVTHKVPAGRITTYGHIAKLLYKPGNSRQVGSSLKALTLGNPTNVPWWRVINSQGKISEREPEKMIEQKLKLIKEGVDVSEGFGVRLSDYGWFPEEVDFD